MPAGWASPAHPPMVDSQGRVKVLDFGLAKLMAPDLSGDAERIPLGKMSISPYYVIGVRIDCQFG